MEPNTFATVINCIDGRVQEPVATWIKEHLDVHYVDTITEPGADRILALGLPDKIGPIREKLIFSFKAHNPTAVVVAGHHDCASNRASKEEHVQYIKHAVQRLVSWRLPVRVLGLWVNERWRVEVIFDTKHHRLPP